MMQSPLMKLGLQFLTQPSCWQVKLGAVHARIRELKAREDSDQNRRDIAAAEHAVQRIEDNRRVVQMTAALLAGQPLGELHVH